MSHPVKKALLIFTYLFLLQGFQAVYSQVNTIAVGFQYKPIFSTPLLKIDPPAETIGSAEFSIRQRSGHCVGMVIRRGINRTLSFESGINYTKRKYELKIQDGTFEDNSRFSIIGYEIPVLLLAYIKLGKQVFMNTALGTVLDIFPSNVTSSDTYFEQLSLRNNIFQPGLLANIGYEYRTINSGYFYFGASFHRPFSSTYRTRVLYKNSTEMNTDLSGSYLTFDFRYFFHEDPIRKSEKKKKTKVKKMNNE